MKASKEVVESVKGALDSFNFNGYPPAIGYESARAAVAKRYTRLEAPLSSNDVIITSGCSGALEMIFSVLAHKDQTILLPQPGFSLYKTLCDNKGIKVKYYRLIPENNWEIDLDQVEKLLDDTVVAWLINNPSNPCGSVYSFEHLQDCKKLAQRQKLIIIADEIYEDLVFSPNTFHPLASVEPRIPLLACGGLAKRFLVPGWRLGWILIHDPTSNGALVQVRSGLVDLAGIILGANSIVQAALPDIFNRVTATEHSINNEYIARNADIIYEALIGTPGLQLVRPQGAFYMMVGFDPSFFDFVDDLEVCERLIMEESVICLPGIIFGIPNFIRLVYCAPPDMITKATDRIKAFLTRHSRKGRELPPPPAAPHY